MKRVIKAMTEEQLNYAIENGKPFDLETFNKYKIDPYRAEGAVKAEVLEVGDIIQVTEDAAEIDCPSPEIEIMDIDRSDPDGYGDNCITFYCRDNATGDEYTLHFWPEEWVGPIVDRKADDSITSSTQSNHIFEWDDGYRPYSGSDHTYYTLRVDGQEIGYVDAWESDGAYGYTAYLKSDQTEYEEPIGESKSLDAAKARLESLARTTQDLIDKFPVTSSETINRYSDVRPYEDRKYWYFTTHGIGPGTIPNDLNVLETREGQNDKGTWGTYICLDGVLNTDELNYYDLRELAPQDITSAEEIEDDIPFDGPKPGHILWNISWWDQRGNQCGESLELPKDEKYPGIAIERYLIDEYGDEYGGIADFMGFDDEGNYITGATDVEDDDESEWDEWDPYQGHKYMVYGGEHQANQAFDDPKKAIQCWFKYQGDAPMDVSIMSKTKADAIELVKAATSQLLTGLHAKYKCPYKLDWLISEAEKQVENGCRSFYEGSYGYGDSVHPFGVG